MRRKWRKLSNITDEMNCPDLQASSVDNKGLDEQISDIAGEKMQHKIEWSSISLYIVPESVNLQSEQQRPQVRDVIEHQ